ncbi:hypothetical protein CCACVL1_02514 [Corchorus capsularis]|uniref:Protein kinase domain-containing protein n=1 Tax=Corchorus capsularis TaxID=210143 RepID=A0A1R3K801_COCAP|nr:hypothetical protein CCACVL1_02514 [Corchorus capsularis]
MENASMDGLRMGWMKVKTLGKGSYGVVHLVKPTNPSFDHQLYAFKTCLYRDSSSLQKELEILSRFRGCPNIVQCYGDMLGFNKGLRVYNLVMEYAPGGNLLDLIKKYGGKIPERDATCYARMLVEGLRNIHMQGYVHCDFKPDNILVYPPASSGFTMSTLKIADFGLARQQGEIIDVPMVEPWHPRFPGTPIYMPPEGIDAEEVNAPLDIWSLGCALLVMLTGKFPWNYKDSIDLASQLSMWGNSPTIPENISIEGKDFLSKCFARNPKERWTAEMLLGHPFLLPDHLIHCCRNAPLFGELPSTLCT